MTEHTTVGIDLAKSVFELAVSRREGHVQERHRLSREGFLRFLAQLQPSTVVMEACGSAHHWGRQIESLGHRVVLLNPQDVRPYAKGRSKTDRGDAAALLEAFRCGALTPIPIKTIDQQGMTALHRLRSGWAATRVARLNALRGVLRELGAFIPVGASRVVPAVRALVEDAESVIPAPLRPILWQALEEINDLNQRLKTVDLQLRAMAKQTPAVQHLLSVPGVGLITATALVAFLGDAKRFSNGRRLASFLGLVPREHSSGLVRRMGSITKRGDPYLRTLLIHGARSLLRVARLRPQENALHAWAFRRSEHAPYNRAAVALANKLTRILWRVWRDGRNYEERQSLVAI